MGEIRSSSVSRVARASEGDRGWLELLRGGCLDGGSAGQGVVEGRLGTEAFSGVMSIEKGLMAPSSLILSK